MFGDILQSARKDAGLSQASLARLGNTYQGNISEFENGVTSPSWDTASELLSSLGYKLIAVPLDQPTLSEWAIALNNALATGKEKRAFRLFLQINDQLTKARPEFLGTICLTRPLIKDPHYLALISGLVQYHLRKNRLPFPSWINNQVQRLSSPWYVENNSRLEKFNRERTPIEFSKLNVFLAESELQSA